MKTKSNQGGSFLDSSMTTKSISNQIIDGLAKELSKSMSQTLVSSLTTLLKSDNIKKEDIVNLLQEEETNEGS